MASPHPNSVCEGESLSAQTLRRLQRGSFDYFLHEVNRGNGLVLDKTAADWPASIAAMGMALTAYLVGAQRRFIHRDDAAQRTLTMLRFLAASAQSDARDATGYKGFYYHFLHMQTGERVWLCELSSIDTALLIAGALAAAQYFDGAWTTRKPRSAPSPGSSTSASTGLGCWTGETQSVTAGVPRLAF